VKQRLRLAAGLILLVAALAACSQGGPSGITVHGTVVDGFGHGFSGATVRIGSASAASGADGSFTIDGVSTPYDAAVYVAGLRPVIHVFEGLTKADPELQALGAVASSMATMNQGTITGDLSSAVPAGSLATVCVEGATQPANDCATVMSGSTSYTLKPQWKSGSSTSVTLHALVAQVDANGYPTGYDAYGTATGTVTNAGSAVIDVPLGAAPSTATLSGGVTVPSGFFLRELTVAVAISPTLSFPVFDIDTPPSQSFSSVPVPVLGQGTYAVLAQADPSTGGAVAYGWQQKLAAGGTASLALTAPPTQVAPADGATGVGTGDELSVTGAGGNALTFVMAPSSPSGAAPLLIVTTLASKATIADLSAFGWTLPATTAYDWGVYVTPTTPTAEDAAAHWYGDSETALMMRSGYPGSRVDAGTQTSGDTHTFTTR